MQNRYLGDVGDFGKFGLLRALCSPPGMNPVLSLGIVWYLTSPGQKELTRNDGKHRSYLNKPQEFRDCDPELFGQMKSFKDPTQRDVLAIPLLGIFPSTTVYYNSTLSFSEMSDIGCQVNVSRQEQRRLWFDGAVTAMCQADIIFIDPDNGLQINSTKPYSNEGPKYITDGELSTFLQYEKKCVILYQHGRRDKEFINKCLKQVGGLSDSKDPFALRYHRGTQRAFIVAPCKHHHALMRERADRFIRGKWGEHFEPKIFRIE